MTTTRATLIPALLSPLAAPAPGFPVGGASCAARLPERLLTLVVPTSAAGPARPS